MWIPVPTPHSDLRAWGVTLEFLGDGLVPFAIVGLILALTVLAMVAAVWLWRRA